MRKILVLALLAPLLLGACSSSPDTRGPGLGGDPFAEQNSSKAPSAGVRAGDVDCASISQQQLLTFGYGVQTLAQLDNQGAVDAVNDGTMAFNPEAFADAVDALRTLDGHGVDPYGDPADALDYYDLVNTAAANLLAYDTPIPEGEFTSYGAVTGGPQQAIGEQSSISASYSANCTG